MSPPTGLDFHRQGIVVADDESPATTLLIETLRLDGHRVTHVREIQFAAVDLALRDCHLFICGAGTGGMHAVHLISDLRDNMPDLPVLCLATALRWTRRLEGLLPAEITMVREPFTAERLRAAVRPLLPLTSGGTTLAWATATRPSGGVSTEETVRAT
ncbi:MAG TPA: response regulator [Gemmatimonadales bacterium]|nr:response regulator [Gemmatimonadales bacterium]